MVGYTGIGLIAMVIGLIPGFLLFEWLASPFGPGLWVLATPFARIFLTVGQFARSTTGPGVLVKRKSGKYEIGTCDLDRGVIVLSDSELEFDQDEVIWNLFGKKDFGITWEAGTDFHNRIMRAPAASSDGGAYPINMAAAHRLLRGGNEIEAINRTESHAEAEYDGNSAGISQWGMAGLIMVMLILGTATAVFLVG